MISSGKNMFFPSDFPFMTNPVKPVEPAGNGTPASPTPGVPESHAAAAIPPDMAAAILIIEDELTLAKNIATYLKRNGYDASVAATGEDGLAQIETLRPEAVVLDYALPGMHGVDVLKRIKAIDPRIAVILMTGHGSELVAVEAMKAGAHDYLIKPVLLSQLKLRLEKLVGGDKRDQAVVGGRGEPGR
jgi:two-component system, NtrC family, response regulator AtoC